MIDADLLYGDVEQQLRDSVRRLLHAQAKANVTSAAYDQPIEFADLRVALLRDIGVAGLLVSSDLGGAGATTREAAVVAEEIGRAVAPVPFLTSSVIATTTLSRTGERELLSALAEGSVTAALALSFVAAELPGRLPVRATDGGLVGSVRSVADAGTADVLLVPADGAGGVELHRVARTADTGVVVTSVPSLDMTRPVSDVVLDGASSRRIDTSSARLAVDLGLRAGAGILASEQLGLAQRCMDATLEYVKQRSQFGRAIGSFQALKHRLADLWVEIGQAGAAARYAADALARQDEDAAIAVSTAQAWCSVVAVRAAEECLQLHGGIGMTWESPIHLYLKRAKANELALGTPFEHRARLGELLGLPPTQNTP